MTYLIQNHSHRTSRQEVNISLEELERMLIITIKIEIFILILSIGISVEVEVCAILCYM